MKARGKYGIGFFSAFMLGERVRVITRRYDRDTRTAKVLEFHNGLGSRPNLREARAEEVPIDGGSRVEVKLRTNPMEPEGVLYREMFPKGAVQKSADVVAAIAPASDVAIKVIQDGETVGSTGAGDWLEIDSAQLLGRIAAGVGNIPKRQSWGELAELRDEDGRIFGRARIEARYGWSPFMGLITVDGLTATKINLIAGILVGIETTVSRNSVSPIVPAPVLAAWASEQAILIGRADMTDADKARSAEVVLACGGAVSELPIIWWRGEWMSSLQLMAAISGTDRLVLHQGDVTHEDDDDVTKRNFESAFEADSEIMQTVSNSYSNVFATEWIRAVAQGTGETLTQVIEEVIIGVWGAAESEEELANVGKVHGTEIYRGVTIYTKVSEN